MTSEVKQLSQQPLEVPERLRQLGESQRLRDIKQCEKEMVRHKAREPLAVGFPVTVCQGDPDWSITVAWLNRVRGSRESMSAPTRIFIVRQEGEGGWWVQGTTVQVAGNGQRRVVEVFKDVISTERFYASWK